MTERMDDERSEGLPYRELSDEIEYMLHDPHAGPRTTKGNLVRLVYDIPYFSGCGVFPPRHIANQWFALGGGDAGMSPGASWTPFRISDRTYLELRSVVDEFDPTNFEDSREVFRMKFILDDSFDHIEDAFEWSEAACEIHREQFFERQERLLRDWDGNSHEA